MKELKFSKGLLASVLLSAGALAACNSGDEGSTAEGGGEQVTVDIFQFKVEFKDQFEDVVTQYEEENPDVNIEITTVGGGEDYGAALRSVLHQAMSRRSSTSAALRTSRIGKIT